MPDAVRLVSSGPACAAGIADRGKAREGMLADLILVGERRGMPEATHVLVGGRATVAVNGS